MFILTIVRVRTAEISEIYLDLERKSDITGEDIVRLWGRLLGKASGQQKINRSLNS
jgi:hypothetical protein